MIYQICKRREICYDAPAIHKLVARTRVNQAVRVLTQLRPGRPEVTGGPSIDDRPTNGWRKANRLDADETIRFTAHRRADYLPCGGTAADAAAERQKKKLLVCLTTVRQPALLALFSS